MTENKQFELESRGNGKQFRVYLAFIDSVKRGEKSIVMGPGYVVLSDSAYRQLIENKGQEP